MPTNKLLIGVGSNIAKTENIESGLQALNNHFGALTISTIFESEAVGFSGSNFLNLVVLVHTHKNIDEVCKTLKNIEDEHGRCREKNSTDRTLDLDLLTYNNVVCSEPVMLPRPEIAFNAFVLQPLAEIAPDELHPILRLSYKQMWANYTNENQRLWPSGMQWSSARP